MNEAEDTRRRLVLTWLHNTTVATEAHMLDRLVRYNPENGWRAVLAVYGQGLPSGMDLASEFEGPLARLLRYHGESVVDRVVDLARRDHRFRNALGALQTNAKIGPSLLDRIGIACGWTPRPRVERPDILRVEAAAELEIDPPTTSDAWHVLDRPRSDIELAAMAQAWIEYHNTHWAFMEVGELVLSGEAEAAWQLVLELVERATADGQLWSIGAGPLEDFLGRHGVTWIDRVEALAAEDAKFAYTLARCWKARMSDDVWRRVEAASAAGGHDSFFAR